MYAKRVIKNGTMRTAGKGRHRERQTPIPEKHTPVGGSPAGTKTVLRKANVMKFRLGCGT